MARSPASAAEPRSSRTDGRAARRSPIRRGVALLVLAALAGWTALGAQSDRETARRRFAIFVVDGLRPDAITPGITPTLARLRDEGVEYANSHSVFPTVTRLNAATLSTGTYPSRHGIVGNSMFVASVDVRTPFDTGDYRRLLALDATAGRVVTTETLGELLRRHGRTLVTVSSGSTGNGFLLNPEARHGAGVVIHGLFERGTTAAYPPAVSDAVLTRFGAPPPDPDDLGQMRWTDTVLRELVLPDLRPDVVIDWLGPLDSAQHADGVGSPAAISALREIDASIGHTLAVLASRGELAVTNVIVTSDHGFARHADGVDAVGALVAAGLKADRTSTDVIVASQSESLLVHVAGHDRARIAAIVGWLQRAPWADVIFTAGGRNGEGGVPGTFSFDVLQIAHPTRAPDVIVSLPWSDAPNAFGVPGSHTIASAATGPVAGGASGHGGLSPWVVRNTFIAAGPDFKRRARIDAPVSLADVAPTILQVFGLSTAVPGPAAGRGRVLRELLHDGPMPRATRRTIRTASGAYRAELDLSAIDGHEYVDAGRRLRPVDRP
ncbi:MAG: alkaline phosphatase family protein [Acidobacteria bacterium]|nr:alkaline phosphatase family protein [Acidobacteriota bacterium]